MSLQRRVHPDLHGTSQDTRGDGAGKLSMHLVAHKKVVTGGCTGLLLFAAPASNFVLQVALVGGMNNSNPMGIYGFSNATLCAFAEPGSEDGTPLRVPVRDACQAQMTLFSVLLSLSRAGH